MNELTPDQIMNSIGLQQYNRPLNLDKRDELRLKRLVREIFEKYEIGLELCLMRGELEENRQRIFQGLRETIQWLLRAGCNEYAYRYAIRYASLTQKYTIH